MGYVTNWLALKLIFNPTHPHKVGPFTFQGVFLKRQYEASDRMAELAEYHFLKVVKLGVIVL